MMEGKLHFHLELLIEGTISKRTHFEQIYITAPRNYTYIFSSFSDNMFPVEPAEIITIDQINIAVSHYISRCFVSFIYLFFLLKCCSLRQGYCPHIQEE